ncbi:hypothetical protein VNO80_05372 [Phaseolus coccineus]|uniref:Uncharacterized protein n=1 Tax=Phaseolus coccineus TaxID=3886 RepID=A0AAN9RHT5_PHACN
MDSAFLFSGEDGEISDLLPCAYVATHFSLQFITDKTMQLTNTSPTSFSLSDSDSHIPYPTQVSEVCMLKSSARKEKEKEEVIGLKPGKNTLQTSRLF